MFTGTTITVNIYLYILEKFIFLLWKEGEVKIFKHGKVPPHNNIFCAALNSRFPAWWRGRESPVT
jgi:hypothetical protein